MTPAVHEPVIQRRLSSDPVQRIPPATAPARSVLAGRYVQLEPLDPERHGEALFQAGQGLAGAADAEPASLWRYLPYGPFESTASMRAWLDRSAPSKDPQFFAVCTPEGQAQGMASYLNIHPQAGSIELGHIWFGFALQRSRAATEAIYLLMRYALQQGFRRVEWKCDAANMPSRRAARRFGFQHEGIFYRATVVKGHNRDTAWYSIIDEEWPPIEAAFEQWLDPANFDAEGRQITPLAAAARG